LIVSKGEVCRLVVVVGILVRDALIAGIAPPPADEDASIRVSALVGVADIGVTLRAVLRACHGGRLLDGGSAIANRAEHAPVNVVAVAAAPLARGNPIMHFDRLQLNLHHAAAAALRALAVVNFLVEVGDVLAIDAAFGAAHFAWDQTGVHG
jgi:hypothetical protein